MPDHSNVARGRWGEALADRHLRRVGHRIVDRNWRSPERGVRGELDIVSFVGDVVVFVEVKARRRHGFGGAAAAVDDRKQQQIRSLAESWLRLHGDAVERVRFDVIAIEGVHLTHLEAAF
ncbi:MAG: YraN family protein [Ilumatobacteraceae bacterium]|nr:YraN family protein [Ilumatobacteraceae bacterium]